MLRPWQAGSVTWYGFFSPLLILTPNASSCQPSSVIFAQETSFAIQVTSGQAQPLQRAKNTFPPVPTEKTPAGVWTVETSSACKQKSYK